MLMAVVLPKCLQNTNMKISKSVRASNFNFIFVLMLQYVFFFIVEAFQRFQKAYRAGKDLFSIPNNFDLRVVGWTRNVLESQVKDVIKDPSEVKVQLAPESVLCESTPETANNDFKGIEGESDNIIVNHKREPDFSMHDLKIQMEELKSRISYMKEEVDILESSKCRMSQLLIDLNNDWPVSSKVEQDALLAELVLSSGCKVEQTSMVWLFIVGVIYFFSFLID